MVYGNSTACYFPDRSLGSQVTPYFVPCDPRLPNSPCCAQGESCTSSGYCYSNNGGMYRGGCTDPDWGVDSGCPQQCLTVDQGGSTSGFTFLSLCGYSGDGSGGYNWACISGDNTSMGCATGAFTAHMGPITNLNITGERQNPSYNATTVTVSGSSATATPTVTASCAAHSNTPVLATGLGVGVPLLLLLLTALGLLFRYRRRANSQSVSSAKPKWQEEIRHGDPAAAISRRSHSEQRFGSGTASPPAPGYPLTEGRRDQTNYGPPAPGYYSGADAGAGEERVKMFPAPSPPVELGGERPMAELGSAGR